MGIMTSPQKFSKSGFYYFRMAVPKSLIPVIGKTVFKSSLRTRDLAEAKRLILPHTSRAQKEIELAKLKLAEKANIPTLTCSTPVQLIELECFGHVKIYTESFFPEQKAKEHDKEPPVLFKY